MKKNIYVIIVAFIFSIILWVSISLSNDYYATLEVPVKLVDFPHGFSTGSRIPRMISIKLKGKGWKLVSIYLSGESNFIVPVGYETGKRNINLYNYISENTWLSTEDEVVNIAPDTISFFIERAFAKKLKIVPKLNINFQKDYGLASRVILSPDSTLVYGPFSYLNKLDSVETEIVSIENLQAKVAKKVSLVRIPGMRFQDNSVNISLDVQKIVEKNFNNVPVKVIDAPMDREVVLFPNQISISLRGGVDILGRIDSTQLAAYVNYRDIVADSLGSVIPEVIIPENSSLIFTNPERLKYIIKKFN